MTLKSVYPLKTEYFKTRPRGSVQSTKAGLVLRSESCKLIFSYICPNNLSINKNTPHVCPDEYLGLHQASHDLRRFTEQSNSAEEICRAVSPNQWK